jgi:hypothetical protein
MDINIEYYKRFHLWQTYDDKEEDYGKQGKSRKSVQRT